MTLDNVRAAIRDIPDFPEPGIIFKDITPVLQDPVLMRVVTDNFVDRYRKRGITKILGIESRGFMFGTPVAREIDAGFVPVRKVGKLPHQTIAQSYDLEYGSATLEMHQDAIEKGEKVVIIDDLLATGGTAEAAVLLAKQLGADIVEVGVLIELAFLRGREVLRDAELYSQIVFD